MKTEDPTNREFDAVEDGTASTDGAATQPTRAHSSETAKLVETPDAAASVAAIPASVAPRAATKEYQPPANAQRADNDVPVYQPGGRFNNEVEGEE
jgi:hypothetical protein